MEQDIYIHGSESSEQARLSILNEILNHQCLGKIGISGEQRILDVGSGLGQMSAVLAAAMGGARPMVVGVERDARQLMKARQNLPDELMQIVEFRQGEVYALPLTAEEWGSFDLVHCRFVLEHLREPQRAVDQMIRATKPGGRVILIDDDHSLFRVFPDLLIFNDLWKRYAMSYQLVGNDPMVGRKLVTLLQKAGCTRIRQDTVFFGSWNGDMHFPLYVENMAGLLTGAEALLLEHRIVAEGEVGQCVKALHEWAQLPDAAMWYVVNLAEGTVSL